MDSRQVASSLRVAADWSGKFGFQYIVTINSDDFRKAFPVHPGSPEPWRDDISEERPKRGDAVSGADAANARVENSVLSTVL
jgi:hypothetical protein